MRLNAEILEPTDPASVGSELVLLHGWGMNNGVWAPILERLQAHHRLTLIELPGHGISEYVPDQSSLQDWAEAALAVAPSRAIWLGWSLGAQVCLQAALGQPGRVRSLVLVAASPRFVTGEGWPQAMPIKTFHEFAANLARDHAGTLERFLALQVRGAAEARETLRQLKAALRDRPAPREAALDNGLELLLRTDLRARLHELTCPTLWLLGERDTLVPAEVAEELHRLLPGAEVRLLRGSAHAPFLSNPAACVRLMTGFLGDTDRGELR